VSDEHDGHDGHDRANAADRGAASVWAAVGVLVVLTVATAVVWVVAATTTRHRAESAADLAALAAAVLAPDGERSACGRARWVAERMRVELRSCRLAGWDALVEVTAEPSGLFATLGPAAARARAGPVERPKEARRTVVSTR
jgi:secretion/DNA translocation related TadE-like protein